MTTFENPTNGYRESVGVSASVLAFLFGWLYFLAKGLWAHAAVQIVLVVVMAAITGGPGALIGLPLWIGYAIAAPSILRKRYLRAGWKET